MGRPDWQTNAVIASYPAESLAWVVEDDELAGGSDLIIDIEVPAGTIGRIAGLALWLAPVDAGAGTEWEGSLAQQPDPLQPMMLLLHCDMRGTEEAAGGSYIYGELNLGTEGSALPIDSAGWRSQLQDVRITADVPLQLALFASGMVGVTAKLLYTLIMGLWLTEVG